MVSSTSYANLRIIGVDGAGAATLGLIYKDMTVDQLKRSITATLRRPVYTWEDLNLYHLGVVMRNDQILVHFNLYDGAIIRYTLANYNLSSRRTVSISSPTNELFIFDSCLNASFREDELKTILALDTEQSRTLLGMPSARMFVDNVLSERGLTAR